MERKWRVAVVGATGMVGQRFVSLLADHPWFEIAVVAASARSAGKTYEEAVSDRWAFDWPIPQNVRPLVVRDASDVAAVTGEVDFVFCAVDMQKDEIRALEDAYAKSETPVVSNNSAHRGTPDVPMIVPELNPQHADVIEYQRRRLGTKVGFVTVKPNCSIQSYVPALTALYDLKPSRVVVSTYQAISGAGKTFKRWRTFEGLPQKMNLPSAPHPFLQYFEEDNRPQTRLDRDFERGMGISLGRLRGDSLFDWRFVGLSHNTLRGAAGGAVLIAELLCTQGYIPKK